MNLNRSFVVLSTAVLIAACGGGNDDSEPPAESAGATVAQEASATAPSSTQPAVAPTRPRSTPSESDAYKENYRLSYVQCAAQGEAIYAQAGTRDPQEAAEWLSAIFRAGDSRDGSTAGCVDALTGKAARFE